MTYKIHPWQKFLDARLECIFHFCNEGKSDIEISHALSMDGPEHVRLIRSNSFNIEKMSRLQNETD